LPDSGWAAKPADLHRIAAIHLDNLGRLREARPCLRTLDHHRKENDLQLVSRRLGARARLLPWSRRPIRRLQARPRQALVAYFVDDIPEDDSAGDYQEEEEGTTTSIVAEIANVVPYALPCLTYIRRGVRAGPVG
jgi:hypothetical protein